MTELKKNKHAHVAGAAGVGGGLAVSIIWAAKEFFQVEIPPEVAVGMTAVITSLLRYFRR